MADIKNVFISHVHEDDPVLQDLKDLISLAGMEVRDGSVTEDKPNDAHNIDYIKHTILKPRIDWASVLIVLISNDTAESWWVNWEIRYAIHEGKRVIGVFAQGATDADVPEELGKCGDAAIVGWQSQRVVDAINGNNADWDNPQTGEPRSPEWRINRYKCS